MTSLDFSLKKIGETRNFILNEIKHDLISENYENSFWSVNYIEHFLVFIFAVSGCVFISAFASLAVVPVGIASSAVGIRICAITAGLKKYQSIINKKGKSMIK